MNTLVLEAGKPLKDAEGEVKATAEKMKMTMEEARKIFGEYNLVNFTFQTLFFEECT